MSDCFICRFSFLFVEMGLLFAIYKWVVCGVEWVFGPYIEQESVVTHTPRERWLHRNTN